MNNEYNTDYYDVAYPGLILKLIMTRKLNYHMVQTYIPSTIYLAVSWLALFVPPQSIAERLAMAMTIMVINNFLEKSLLKFILNLKNVCYQGSEIVLNIFCVNSE
jgi:hypothetical protein